MPSRQAFGICASCRFAAVKSALEMSAAASCALTRLAPARLIPLRSAPSIWVPSKLAPTQSASRRSASRRSAPARFAPLRSMRCKSACLSFAPRRSAWRNVSLATSSNTAPVCRSKIRTVIDSCLSVSGKTPPTASVWTPGSLNVPACISCTRFRRIPGHDWSFLMSRNGAGS